MFYQNKRNNEQSRETDNIGYTRQRKTKHNTEKLTTQGTQDKEKQNKNTEKLTTQGTQDKEKKNTTQRN